MSSSKYRRGTPGYVAQSQASASDRISQLEENAIEEVRQRRFLKAMALKESLGLTTEERHSLAQLLPTVDKDHGGSWKELSPKELHDLITMMEGFVFIHQIMTQRGYQYMVPGDDSDFDELTF